MRDGYRIQGLRLVHGEEEGIAEVEWDKGEGEWITQEVLEGHELIGLKCSAKAHTVVQRIGFIFWQPKRTT